MGGWQEGVKIIFVPFPMLPCWTLHLKCFGEEWLKEEKKNKKLKILYYHGPYMKLGLGSKTKIFIISTCSDEINVKAVNLCCVYWKRIYAADVLSIRHYLPFLDTCTIVSDVLGGLTEQHERKEGTINIHWRPTKC